MFRKLYRSRRLLIGLGIAILIAFYWTSFFDPSHTHSVYIIAPSMKLELNQQANRTNPVSDPQSIYDSKVETIKMPKTLNILTISSKLQDKELPKASTSKTKNLVKPKLLNDYTVSRPTQDKKTQKTIKLLTHIEVNKTRSYYKYLINLTDSSTYEKYLQTVMAKESSCQNASSYDAILAVHSAPNNVAKRNMFRWLYTDYQKTSPYKIKVLFFIGLVKSPSLQSQLTNESLTFGDLVQGSFLDAYKNLTYKAMFSYKWIDKHCSGLKLLIRSDDDVFMDVHNLFSHWRGLDDVSSNTIACDIVQNDIVWRTGKWLLKTSEIAEDTFLFPHCRGYFALVTPDLVSRMGETMRLTPFFWIDDVFVYGFVAQKVGATYVSVDKLMARWNESKFTTCFQKLGRKCSLLSVLAKPDQFKYLFSLTRNTTAI
ncbi:beta-1,3-galactosyltransferase 5 [Biomphalaria glabrata]|nr:beta-1,3-galactosyltransferase 5 [Biomphalaria glabrata]